MIELVLVTLLVTTYTCVGFLALWAATSPRHWFVRTAVVLGVLLVPLLIPAYELIVVFTLQTLVIVVGVTASQWRKRRRARNGESKTIQVSEAQGRDAFRFSLVTLLLFTPVAAVIVVVISKMATDFPAQNMDSVTTLALNGVAGGLPVLLGAWLIVAQRKWLAWLVTIVLCIGVAAIMAWFDWFFVAVTGDQAWPPNRSSATGLGLTEPHPQLTWLAIVPVIMLAAWLIVSLWRVAMVYPKVECAAVPSAPPSRMRRAMAIGALGLLFALSAIPPAAVFWRLTHPLPLPSIDVVEVNGLKDIVAAGQAFGNSPILSMSAEPKSTDELAAEVAKYSAAYDQLDRGMSLDVQVQSWPKHGNLMSMINLPNIQELRSAARGLARKAELAQQQGRYLEAARISLQNMRLGQATMRDGLVIDFLVGLAIEGIGQHTLYRAVQQLNADECRQLISELTDIEHKREPWTDALSRDRAWSDHAYGWMGRLFAALNNIAPTYDSSASLDFATRQKKAVSCLMILEAALRAFQIEHGKLPQQLQLLCPDYLAELPIDPFDPSGGLLQYVRADDGYILYSVGYDGDDDGGGPPERSEYGGFDIYGNGDFSLDVFLADESPVDSSGDTTADGLDDDEAYGR